MRLEALTILALALCGCSQRQSDLQQARTTRSVLAEWALLAEMRAQLPDGYVREMREEAQSELGAVTSSANKAGTPASRTIAAAANLEGDPPPALLHARFRAARTIENSLEAR